MSRVVSTFLLPKSTQIVVSLQIVTMAVLVGVGVDLFGSNLITD